MILIVSNLANEAAPELVGLFPPGAASLLAASSFHQSFKGGISIADFASSTFTIDGHNLKPDDITGVITTIPGFLPVEFYGITPADRNYVCAELNAFFVYFLSALKCRKLNPPGRQRLTGLDIQKIEWVQIAESLKIPVTPFTMANGRYEFDRETSEREIVTCTVVGDQIVEDETEEEIQHYVKQLARQFALPYLSCSFSVRAQGGYSLADISSIPDLSTAKCRKIIASYFQDL